MSRRRRPEGSVTKVLVKGKYTYWQARLSRTGYFDGKRQREAHYFKTQAQANDWLRQQLRQGPRKAGERLTVEEWLPRWLDEKRPAYKPRVRERNEGVYRNHVIPVIGKIRLDQLTSDDVRRVLRRAETKTGRGGRALDPLKVYMVLRAALTDAYQAELIPNNPADRVRTPETRPSQRTTLTVGQATALLREIDHKPMAALLMLPLLTGMRSGETLGLTWDEVEDDWSLLHVRHELQWLRDAYARVGDRLHEDVVRAISYKPSRDGETRPFLVTPKGKLHSVPGGKPENRAIPLAPIVAETLRALKVEQAGRLGIKADGLVFLTDQKTPYRPENANRALAQFCTAARVPVVTFHELRHSANSALEALKIDAETRAVLLGHRVDVNVNVYTHITPEQRRSALELLGTRLTGA